MREAGTEGGDLLLQVIEILGVDPTINAVATPNLTNQLGTTSLELVVAELPPAGRLHAASITEGGVALDLSETVEVELTDEGREVVVLEELRDVLGGEGHGILNHEGIASFRPTSNVRVVLMAVLDKQVALTKE